MNMPRAGGGGDVHRDADGDICMDLDRLRADVRPDLLRAGKV